MPFGTLKQMIMAATLSMPLGLTGVVPTQAQDSKFPNWEGQWGRQSRVGIWDDKKPPGLGQQAPLTPEYQKVWEAMKADLRNGYPGNWGPTFCIPAGMPGMMSMTYGMEIQHTPGKVTIYGELNDVYRRIYLDGRTPQKRTLDDPTFSGYSVGHWEGDTLVVDTTNFVREGLFRFSSAKMHLVERFKLDDDQTLRYDFTITDPETWTKPFTVSMPMIRSSEQMFEYACHEGNIGLEGVLKGARFQDKNPTKSN